MTQVKKVTDLHDKMVCQNPFEQEGLELPSDLILNGHWYISDQNVLQSEDAWYGFIVLTKDKEDRWTLSNTFSSFRCRNSDYVFSWQYDTPCDCERSMIVQDVRVHPSENIRLHLSAGSSLVVASDLVQFEQVTLEPSSSLHVQRHQIRLHSIHAKAQSVCLIEGDVFGEEIKADVGAKIEVCGELVKESPRVQLLSGAEVTLNKPKDPRVFLYGGSNLFLKLGPDQPRPEPVFMDREAMITCMNAMPMVDMRQ